MGETKTARKQLMIRLLLCIGCAVISILVNIGQFLHADQDSVPELAVICIACLVPFLTLLKYPFSDICTVAALFASMGLLFMPKLDISGIVIPVMFIIAYLCIYSHEIVSVLSLLLFFLTSLIFLVLENPSATDSEALASYNIIAFIVAVISYIFRYEKIKNIQRVSREHEKAVNENIAHLRNNLFLASQMHDHLANKLAGLSLVIQSNVASAQNSAEQNKWMQIAPVVNRSIQLVHQIIDQLTSPQNNTAEQVLQGSIVSLTDIRTFVQRQQKICEQENLRGFISIQGVEKAAVSPQSLSEIESITEEVMTNVRRHMPSKQQYVVRIRLTQDSFTLVEMNPIRYAPLTRGVPSGRGIRLHQSLIKTLHGSVETSSSDQTWIIRVRIPLQARQD